MAIYEGVFDIIDEVHLHLAHAKESCTVYNLIGKFGTEMPKTLLRCTETKPSKAESLGQLQMMISDTVGSRAQMDLVDMHRGQVSNFKWILHYVGLKSGFSHIACLENKKAKTGWE